jgi:hypothetical protein
LILDDFDFNASGISDQLTGEMATLKSYNPLRVLAGYFDEAMKRLRNKYLSVPLDAVRVPVSRRNRQPLLPPPSAVIRIVRADG